MNTTHLPENASEEDLRAFLQAGRVRIERFGRPGKKKFEELHKEVTERSVALLITKRRRVLRIANSVKVVIWGGPDMENRFTLREIKRVFDNDKDASKKKKKPKVWGLSETKFRHEHPVNAVLRGIREEFDFEADLASIKPIEGLEERIKKPSSVFPDITSYTFMQWYEWDSPPLFYTRSPHGYAAREASLTVHSEWFPI